MATKGNIWRNGMDIRYVTTRWHHPKTFHNSLLASIERKLEKRENKKNESQTTVSAMPRKNRKL